MSKTIQEKIEVMQHYANGGVIDIKNILDEEWNACVCPRWNWGDYDYRIVKQKKTILIEKWLYKHKNTGHFTTKEGCKNWLEDLDVNWIKVKILDFDEVEL